MCISEGNIIFYHNSQSTPLIPSLMLTNYSMKIFTNIANLNLWNLRNRVWTYMIDRYLSILFFVVLTPNMVLSFFGCQKNMPTFLEKLKQFGLLLGSWCMKFIENKSKTSFSFYLSFNFIVNWFVSFVPTAKNFCEIKLIRYNTDVIWQILYYCIIEHICL